MILRDAVLSKRQDKCGERVAGGEESGERDRYLNKTEQNSLNRRYLAPRQGQRTLIPGGLEWI